MDTGPVELRNIDIGPKNPVMKAGQGLVDFADERSGVTTGAKWFLFRNIPKETSWFQTLGFTAMVLFSLQAITGIVLAMYYRPDTAGGAYSSIEHITNEVTWGWLVRGMHKWGASAMIIIVFLHMGRVFLFGSYKYPRELTWVTGALLLILTMFMGLTGYLLVWDQKAYWATIVAVNITASAPILGPYVADIMRGGAEFGPETLSRFYSIHMLVIPGGIATFLGLHLFFVSKLGISEPPYSKRRMRVERAEAAAKQAAEAERLQYGRRKVTAAPTQPQAPVGTEERS
ncbi:MAG TPA: cytochrome b N-terminal domain-containing protein [Miltoncostaeaceae bacterium]|nr:cytochrome b N-terminal domain-containing protein [Miltoncostaeaceae bacterium]